MIDTKDPNIKQVLSDEGEKWYVRKIDSTHLYMSNNMDIITGQPPFSGNIVYHVAQLKHQSYYQELLDFLRS